MDAELHPWHFGYFLMATTLLARLLCIHHFHFKPTTCVFKKLMSGFEQIPQR